MLLKYIRIEIQQLLCYKSLCCWNTYLFVTYIYLLVGIIMLSYWFFLKVFFSRRCFLFSCYPKKYWCFFLKIIFLTWMFSLQLLSSRFNQIISFSYHLLFFYWEKSHHPFITPLFLLLSFFTRLKHGMTEYFQNFVFLKV